MRLVLTFNLVAGDPFHHVKGLGKNKQGITSPLVAQKTGSGGSGVILDRSETRPSRIILLQASHVEYLCLRYSFVVSGAIGRGRERSQRNERDWTKRGSE